MFYVATLYVKEVRVCCSPVRIEIEYKYIQSCCWIHTSKHINMKTFLIYEYHHIFMSSVILLLRQYLSAASQSQLLLHNTLCVQILIFMHFIFVFRTEKVWYIQNFHLHRKLHYHNG